MAKKIQLQDASGNTLHPLTLGECVTMDNGENLDTLMSKSQMFTPIITQDKSMFKVGTGIDVDYSANVKDGAYESLVFKGKSLVNLVEKPTSENVGSSKKWNGYGGGNPSKAFITNGIRLTNTQHGSIVLDYFDISLFKPNTKYTLFIDVYHNGEGTAPVLDKIAGTGQYAIPLKNGHNCIVFTTIPDLTGANMGIRFGYAGSTSASCVYEFSNIIIIEGDHSSIDPDYFEGLCDSKMPILRNVGKNLFNPTVPTPHHMVCNGATDGGLVGVIPVKPNTTYTLSVKKDTTKGRFIAKMSNKLLTLQDVSSFSQSSVYNYLRDNYANGRKFEYTIHNQKSLTFTTLDDCHYIYVNVDRSFGTPTANEILVFSEMTLEESPTQTTYEDYKTNILRTPEEIVLREVGEVCDTYNPLTGEYTKRIGEIILNGTEKWGNFRDETDTTWRTSFSLPDAKPSSVCICDKFIYGKGATEEKVKVYITVTPNLSITVLKSEFPTLEAFKTWLSQNPVTIQYELAEPVTTIVKPSTMTPFAYQNGHAIVESGFEGQSLLPEIEYSVVTGRTGQVTQNTKVLRKQEQQIISLEELLLTQVVQMEYERTLLQFDYELQMMMLG